MLFGAPESLLMLFGKGLKRRRSVACNSSSRSKHSIYLSSKLINIEPVFAQRPLVKAAGAWDQGSAFFLHSVYFFKRDAIA